MSLQVLRKSFESPAATPGWRAVLGQIGPQLAAEGAHHVPFRRLLVALGHLQNADAIAALEVGSESAGWKREEKKDQWEKGPFHGM